MIRRSSLERIGGYGAVRADVAEDLRTATLLKSSGARLRIDYAPELLRTRMQTDLKEIWEGFTKNLFAELCRYPETIINKQNIHSSAGATA